MPHLNELELFVKKFKALPLQTSVVVPIDPGMSPALLTELENLISRFTMDQYELIMDKLAALPTLNKTDSALMTFSKPEYSHLFFDILKRTPHDKINAVNINGYDALMFASSVGTLEQVQALIEQGANTKTVNRHGHTALMRAAFKGNIKTVDLLLKNGAEINAQNHKDIQNMSALMYAIAENHFEVIKLLISRGANVNAAREFMHGDRRESVLMLAMHEREIQPPHSAIIRDPESCVEGALHIQPQLLSREIHREKILSLLAEKGADILFRDQDTRTNTTRNSVIHTSVTYGYVHLMFYLLLKQNPANNLGELKRQWARIFDAIHPRRSTIRISPLQLLNQVVEDLNRSEGREARAAIFNTALDENGAIHAYLSPDLLAKLTALHKNFQLQNNAQDSGTSSTFTSFDNDADDRRELIRGEIVHVRRCNIL